MDDRAAHVDGLAHAITDEIFTAIGLSRRRRWLRGMLAPAVRTPARRFAALAAEFDEYAGRCGFAEASRLILPRFIKGYRACGTEEIPRTGPLIVASNHPGAYDSLIICACLPRDDLKILASDVPFLRSMPNSSAYIIYTGSAGGRMIALRSMIRHLQEGGALVIFPSGFVDPDPEFQEGAHEALEDWSTSLEICMSRVPETQVQPAIVSGVLSEACWRSRIARLPRKPWQRRKLAEFIQVIEQMAFGRSFPLNPRVSFGPPLSAGRLPSGRGGRGRLAVVIEKAQCLLAEHVAGSSCDAREPSGLPMPAFAGMAEKTRTS